MTTQSNFPIHLHINDQVYIVSLYKGRGADPERAWTVNRKGEHIDLSNDVSFEQVIRQVFQIELDRMPKELVISNEKNVLIIKEK